jgi:hypothetical protein
MAMVWRTAGCLCVQPVGDDDDASTDPVDLVEKCSDVLQAASCEPVQLCDVENLHRLPADEFHRGLEPGSIGFILATRDRQVLILGNDLDVLPEGMVAADPSLIVGREGVVAIRLSRQSDVDDRLASRRMHWVLLHHDLYLTASANRVVARLSNGCSLRIGMSTAPEACHPAVDGGMEPSGGYGRLGSRASQVPDP